MSVLVTITEGWTKKLGPFTIRNNGAAVEIPGTATTALKLRSSASSEFRDVSGDVEIAANQSTTGKGQFYYTPDADDMRALHSPYYMRMELTDDQGTVYFPNGDPDSIVVKQK